MSIRRVLRPFKRRVTIERKVLGLVNTALVECEPLAGLTEEAIYAWAENLTRIYDAAKGSHIAEIVTQISARSRLNTDHSRDVLSNDAASKAGSIAKLLEKLETRLQTGLTKSTLLSGD